MKKHLTVIYLQKALFITINIYKTGKITVLRQFEKCAFVINIFSICS